MEFLDSRKDIIVEVLQALEAQTTVIGKEESERVVMDISWYSNPDIQKQQRKVMFINTFLFLKKS
jgi:hypothetical protein